MNKQKVIFLDRDGVINYDSPDYIKSPEEFHFIPGSINAIVELTKAGYQIGVATNQSGLSRGLYDLPTLEAIHLKMCHEIESAGGKIHHIEFCPHLPDAGCGCRKPKPGMLIKLAEKFAVDLSHVFFVGDKLTDVEAAKQAGARPVYLGSKDGIHLSSPENILCYSSLYHFVNQDVLNASF